MGGFSVPPLLRGFDIPWRGFIATDVVVRFLCLKEAGEYGF
jgi:hypothetical protein